MNEKNIRTLAGPLKEFSLGLISKRQAVEELGLRDYADLLLALGAAGLPLPTLSDADAYEQVKTFMRIWRNS